jgi:hypothetical protein
MSGERPPLSMGNAVDMLESRPAIGALGGILPPESLVSQTLAGIIDVTGRVGLLHGHNHPRFLASRRRFADRQEMGMHKTYFSAHVATRAPRTAARNLERALSS